jgi:1-aminocyclopropane-1-carboxylate deaminase
MAIDLLEANLQGLESAFLEARDIRLSMLRLDRVHPLVSGNKWFKLKEYIAAAQGEGKRQLLTFGGAFSNHLLATAAAAKAFDLAALGYVRGFHAREALSPTLADCARLGMDLRFLSRADYDRKSDPFFLQQLQETFPGAQIIPEGGNHAAGRRGAGAIAALIPEHADLVALPVGTGTTFCGIRDLLRADIRMLGFAGFKNGAYLEQEIKKNLAAPQANWDLVTEFHFGGFARHRPDLVRFMNDFYRDFSVPLDFIYTGKMMFGLFQMIAAGRIKPGSSVCAIHTGGLQGNRSLESLDF